MTPSQINITDFIDGHPRIRDADLAACLGYRRPRSIRAVIVRYRVKLLRYGPLPSEREIGTTLTGPAAHNFWLNEKQALWLTGVVKPKDPVNSRHLLRTAFASFGLVAPVTDLRPAAVDLPPKAIEPLIIGADQTARLIEASTPLAVIRIDGLPEITPILHHGVAVMTTELLARVYGVTPKIIHNGYARNASRFLEGKHLYKLTHGELKAFRHSPSLRGLVANQVKHLTLWTKRGAARHAKLINTDAAWDVFEKLEDAYFDRDEQHATATPAEPADAPTPPPAPKAPPQPTTPVQTRTPALTATMFLDGWMRLDMVVPVTVGFDMLETFQTKLLTPPTAVHH